MKAWRKFTDWFGSLPSLWVLVAFAAGFMLWAILDLLVLRASGGLANSTYDAMVRARVITQAPDPRIVIIDIDETSLARMSKEFGRWPWPRDTLATVLDFIEKQQPAAIAWDILFSDADRLSPGGDKAFDDMVRRSPRSHFSVVRLPREADAQSQLTSSQLPGLWLPGNSIGSSKTATLAVIAPVLPAVAAAKLGYNNGYPDEDGVLRRYRVLENLPDGSRIQSMALAVGRSLQSEYATKIIANFAYSTPEAAQNQSQNTGDLMVWRAKAHAYPRVSFADVFALAEGGQAARAVPSFSKAIVMIGSTASSLHDIHPSPLAAQHAGVDLLATAIDNAVNGHQLAELPRSWLALMACLLIAGMSFWVWKHGMSALDPVLLPLPALLLFVSYVSLNIGSVFIDLKLAAGLALLYIAMLKVWNGWRRNHWCADSPQPESMMALHTRASMADASLDRIIRWLERHAPNTRLMGGDATANWPAQLRWPEALMQISLIGPRTELERLALQEHALISQKSAVQNVVSQERSLLVAQAAQLHLFATSLSIGESA
jgi:adenylate cyclase